jgi:hypothetical protein
MAHPRVITWMFCSSIVWVFSHYKPWLGLVFGIIKYIHTYIHTYILLYLRGESCKVATANWMIRIRGLTGFGTRFCDFRLSPTNMCKQAIVDRLRNTEPEKSGAKIWNLKKKIVFIVFTLEFSNFWRSLWMFKKMYVATRWNNENVIYRIEY